MILYQSSILFYISLIHLTSSSAKLFSTICQPPQSQTSCFLLPSYLVATIFSAILVWSILTTSPAHSECSLLISATRSGVLYNSLSFWSVVIFQNPCSDTRSYTPFKILHPHSQLLYFTILGTDALEEKQKHLFWTKKLYVTTDGSVIKKFKKWHPQCTGRCVISDKFASMHTIKYQAN